MGMESSLWFSVSVLGFIVSPNRLLYYFGLARTSIEDSVLPPLARLGLEKMLVLWETEMTFRKAHKIGKHKK